MTAAACPGFLLPVHWACSAPHPAADVFRPVLKSRSRGTRRRSLGLTAPVSGDNSGRCERATDVREGGAFATNTLLLLILSLSIHPSYFSLPPRPSHVSGKTTAGKEDGKRTHVMGKCARQVCTLVPELVQGRLGTHVHLGWEAVAGSEPAGGAWRAAGRGVGVPSSGFPRVEGR